MRYKLQWTYMIFYVKLIYQKCNFTAFEYTGSNFWSSYFVASLSTVISSLSHISAGLLEAVLIGWERIGTNGRLL
jgi:hypothetical protein